MRSCLGGVGLVVAALGAVGCSTDEMDDYVVNSDIATASSGDMYVAGYRDVDRGFVKHVEGGAWMTVHESEDSLTGVWAGEDGFVIAVGSMGQASVQSNGTWTTVAVPDRQTLTAVWGTASTNVLAVGQEGAVARYDGTQFQREEVPSSATLHDVWGSSADDVFVVGNAGTILHFDGAAWQPMESGTTEDLNAVWGTGSDNVFAVGGSELTLRHVILRFDGATWQTERTGSPYGLLSVNGTPSGRIVSVGAVRFDDETVTAVLLTREGSSWRESKPGIANFLWDVQPLEDGSSYVIGPDDTLARVR